jgi:cyclophilin family peptidyl-prolyl cis-trans isomerase
MKLIIGSIVLAMLAMVVIAGCPRQQAADSATSAAADQSINQSAGETPDGAGMDNAAAPQGTASEPVDAAGNPMSTGPTANTNDAAPPANPPQGDPNMVRVVLETTKGKIVFAVHKDWAPLGADHFIELVNAKFYDGAPWFRVIDAPDPMSGQMKPFVAQCGVAADPAMNTAWEQKTIKDEPVVTGNKPGTVAFGKTMAPDSRSTHIFINLSDNSAALDGQGFAAFAEVVEGIDIASKLTKCEYSDQGGLAAPGGLDAFKKMFPNADFITKAYVEQ